MIQFKSLEEAERRIVNPARISAEEARALSQWLQPLHTHVPRLSMELSLQQIEAIERFNSTTTKFVYIQIGVAVIQVLIALVALYWSHHR